MKDKAVMPDFERMSARFEQDLAALENQIAESEMEKPTFEEPLEFSNVDAGGYSHRLCDGKPRPKQRVQNVPFPTGLTKKGILNSDNNCLFSQLESFLVEK
jgi:hypothetical protein